MGKKRLKVTVASIMTDGAWVVDRISGCELVTVAGVECFHWKNGDYYSVTEMTTGGCAGNGFTLEEALVTAEMNFTSGKWDKALIKAKKVMQECGIPYPLNPTKTHPIIL